jgi:hypothetical protein
MNSQLCVLDLVYQPFEEHEEFLKNYSEGILLSPINKFLNLKNNS